MAMALASWLSLLLSLGILCCQKVGAQQTYNEQDQLGYVCSGTDSCQAYAAYTAGDGDSFLSIGSRFGLSAEQVAQASGLPTNAAISTGQLVLVPLNCSCVNGRSQFNTTYIIQKDDTMYLVSVNTFEGLTTWQAVVNANPNNAPTKLEPGDRIIFPIRCACPSASQKQAGVQSLVTYSIGATDTIGKISQSWNLSSSDLNSANKDPDLAKSIRGNTTLLLPVRTDPPALPTSSRNSSVPALNSPPPTSPSPPTQNGPSHSNSSLNTAAVAGIAAGSAIGALLAALVMFWAWRAKRGKSRDEHVGDGSMYYAGTPKTSARDTDYSTLLDVSAPLNDKSLHRELIDGLADMLDSDKPIVFSYPELLKATDDFSPRNRIQGSVYRAVLRDQIVAVKEMKSGATSQELKILAKVHHMNLVRLLGLCSSGDKLFIVYEYAENGSLNNYLQETGGNRREPGSGTDSTSTTAALLNWNTRLQIALDVASGLEYIHDYTKPSFVHKDIKSSNILLDSNFRAKIANFGMARLVESSRDGSSIPPAALTTHVTGTQGYMAPEYLAHGFVSTKLDVFAFGVVLLELVTGREAVLNGSRNTQSRFLSDVFVELMREGDSETKIEKIKRWLDPSLDKAVLWDVVYRLVELARSCIDEDPAARPNMKDVAFALSKVVETSIQWETDGEERTLHRESSLLQGR